MFNINFIGKSGIQKEQSDASWSYIHKRETTIPPQNNSNNSKYKLLNNYKWKYYILSLLIIIFIIFIELLNVRYTKINPDMVLNQVIDMIVESGYLKEIELDKAIFSLDRVEVIIRSRDFTNVHNLTQGYRVKNIIPYEMYTKNEYSYLSLAFPWEGNNKGGKLITLESLAKKTVFSNKIKIVSKNDVFQINGRSSDIISYLLQMADSDQIQKFSFSVVHLDTGEFNLTINLNKS